MNLQGKANGRKMVIFGKVWNLQGTENARKDKLESARNGNCKEWNLEGNGICKEWNLQGIEFARNGICKEWNLQVKVTFNVNVTISCNSENVFQHC